MAISSTSSTSSSSNSVNFISWLTDRAGHEFLLKVDHPYIEDNFNLYGLRSEVTYFEEALDMLLSEDIPEDEDYNDPKFQSVYDDAIKLYARIHSRFCASPQGLYILKSRYTEGDYGHCPRSLCRGQNMLPVDPIIEFVQNEDGKKIKGNGPLRLFCPRCCQLYIPGPRFANLRNSYFGAGLPYMLLVTYPTLIPSDPLFFEERIFGFRVHGKKSRVRVMLESEIERGAMHIRLKGVGTIDKTTEKTGDGEYQLE